MFFEIPGGDRLGGGSCGVLAKGCADVEVCSGIAGGVEACGAIVGGRGGKGASIDLDLVLIIGEDVLCGGAGGIGFSAMRKRPL